MNHGVLAIDDDRDWLDVLQMAFKRGGVSHPVTGMTDGAEAMRYLTGDGPYADRTKHPLPGLVLLDLRLLGMNGLEVLEWIRQQPALGGLRVVILAGSYSARDQERAKALGADAIISKPYSFPNAIELARSLESTWLQQSPSPGGA